MNSESGHCFRIGGDEFVVIIDAGQEALNELREAFEKRIEDRNKDRDKIKWILAFN